MSTKQTFRAVCPVTGETATRTSAHPYAGSVTVVARRIADYTSEVAPGAKPSVTVKRRGQPLPEGYVVVQQPGRNMYGYAVHLTPRSVDRFEESATFLGSFHESEDLARSAAMTWLAHRPCLALVRVVFVPAEVVAKPARADRKPAADLTHEGVRS